MKSEWTAQRIEVARKTASVIREKDFVGGEFFSAAIDKIERLQARVAELEAAETKAGAVGGMVLVPRDLVDWLRNVLLDNAEESDSKRGAEKLLASAETIGACLDAPEVRVAGPGDVVIPAAVVESAGRFDSLYLSKNHYRENEWVAITDGRDAAPRGFGGTQQESINALAAALVDGQT